MHQKATYTCDDTRGCVMQFWPPGDEHMCSKHVEAWNKLIVKQKCCASSWLITEINILRCTVSKMAKRLIISRSILVRMTNVSGKRCTENQNTHFVFSNFFLSLKSYRLWDKFRKILQSQIGNRWQNGACALHTGYLILMCAIPVVCLNYMVRWIQSKTQL